MDLTTYAGLQAAALEFMTRAGQTGQAPTWITLGEAKLNRKLGAIETNATLVGTIGSRAVSTASLAVVEPIALFIAQTGIDERELQQQSARTLAYRDSSGRPSQWCMDADTSIKFDTPCDVAYSFRFRFRERFALSALVTTNWLLANHPDVYLAATMMWGAGYNEDWANGATWKGLLDEGINEIGDQIAASHKGELRVDPALSMIGRRGSYENWRA